MDENALEIIARGLAAMKACQGGLSTEGWRDVMLAGAALERRPGPRTVKEQWLVDMGRRVSAWLGPADDVP